MEYFKASPQRCGMSLLHESHDSYAPQDGHIFVTSDTVPIPSVDNDVALHSTDDVITLDAVMEGGFDINDFFNLHEAAIDSSSVEASPLPQKLLNESSHNTSPTTMRTPFPEELDNDLAQFVSAERHRLIPPEPNQWGTQQSNEVPVMQTTCIPTSTVKLNKEYCPTLKRSAVEAEIPGIICFVSGTALHTQKKQKILTAEQREATRRVRAKGACLRCRVYKLKCSEGYPCERCESTFNKAYGSKTLQWTACVSSHLPDINIFAYGITILDDGQISMHGGKDSIQDPLQHVSMTLYECMLSSIDVGGDASLLANLDTLYKEVFEYLYGCCADEVHPFILRDRNPLHMLVQTNVILLGSPIIAEKLIGYVRYLQKMRAICGVLAFEALDKALERSTLAASSFERQVALIIQIALLLDQVVEMKGKLPAAVVCFAQDKTYGDMHQHLTQYIFYYFRKLISGVFDKDSPILKYCCNNDRGLYLDESFWASLSDLTGCPPLGKPLKTRKYADIGWKASYRGKSYGDPRFDLGELYHTLYSTGYPVRCN